ncbi:hypothetical protein C8R44DRAFT_863591 [Mycena epipterygia]|nr:hypothetical protein C8R44DRAFT_863591 [Mycena epipterygia]
MLSITSPAQIRNLTFSLDGTPTAALFTSQILQAIFCTILYSVPVLAADGLDNASHTLVAQTGSPSLFIFDYAMYTVEDDGLAATAGGPTTSGENSSVQGTTTASAGPVVVGSICGVVALALLLFAVAFFQCRKRRIAGTQRRLEGGPAMDIVPWTDAVPNLPSWNPGWQVVGKVVRKPGLHENGELRESPAAMAMLVHPMIETVFECASEILYQ